MALPEGQQMEAIQYFFHGRIRRIRRGHSALAPHTVGEELVVHILHDAERRLMPLLPVQMPAIQSDLPGLFPDQSAQAPGEGGLTHAVGAGDGHHFPRAG